MSSLKIFFKPFGDLISNCFPLQGFPSREVEMGANADDNNDDDDLSELSGLSDMSGQDWKPNMTGKLAWLHRAMAR